MDGFIILVALAFLATVFVLPIVAFVRSGRAARETEQLGARLRSLEAELIRLRTSHEQQLGALRTAVERGAAAHASQPESRPAASSAPPPVPEPSVVPPVPMPPPVVLIPAARPATPSARMSPQPPPAAPPPIQPIQPRPAAFDFDKLKGSLNWEQFMGAKLFAWIGGLALFLGVAYFVKYSFEHNLIPPEVRVALGFLVGIGLVAGGTVMRRREYAITAHTFCATGIVILYAVTFACRAVYHFPFFGPVPTFGWMALVTAAAFLLALRLDAQVVALLGMLGGFLTPVLLSTGQDAPVALFAYVALLDAGLLAVALCQRWFYLASLATACTALMQVSVSVARADGNPQHRILQPDDDPAAVQRALAGGHPGCAQARPRGLVPQSFRGGARRRRVRILILLSGL